VQILCSLSRASLASGFGFLIESKTRQTKKSCSEVKRNGVQQQQQCDAAVYRKNRNILT